jgi:CDP-diacylglycerol--serine O-phosphatidyltransferase
VGLDVARDDGSRDRRIDDPTNTWGVHLLGRLLLPWALRLRVSANPVSVAGLVLGSAAASAYWRWPDPRWATLGFLLCIGWLVADGLDGMIARATHSASDLGRLLDGLCDHAVFVLLYVSLAASIGTAAAWLLAVAAGAAHAMQSTLFEGERTRFHRRLGGKAAPVRAVRSRPALLRLYESLAGAFDAAAEPFERLLRAAPDPGDLGRRYAARAVPPLRLMSLLTNNMRVVAIYLACLAGNPGLFWWLELGPLSAVAIAGIAWHRAVERRIVSEAAQPMDSSA